MGAPVLVAGAASVLEHLPREELLLQVEDLVT
jgi:hypothetical protein